MIKRKKLNLLQTALPHNPDSDGFLLEFKDLLKSQWYTNRGPYVQRFESQIKDYLQDPNLGVVACANATLGLELALKGLGLKGKVIVSPFTFVATVHAIVNAGLEPVFADIDPETLCLCPEAVDRTIDSNVSAILPVHVFGNACAIEDFEVFRENGLRVLFDAAHAFGVKYKGAAVGTFGDAEVFSFHATKILSCFEGGAITSHDKDFIQAVARQSNFGILNEVEVASVGTNAKMSEFHALVGTHSLAVLNENIQLRKQIDHEYRNQLAELKFVTCLKSQSKVDTNYQYFPILLETNEQRDNLYNYLRKQQIIVRKYFFPPIHQLKAYSAFRHCRFPVTEDISSRILCLPIHSYLRQEDVTFIVESIRNFNNKTLLRKAS